MLCHSITVSSWSTKIWSSSVAKKTFLHGLTPMFVKTMSKSTFQRLQKAKPQWSKASSTTSNFGSGVTIAYSRTSRTLNSWARKYRKWKSNLRKLFEPSLLNENFWPKDEIVSTWTHPKVLIELTERAGRTSWRITSQWRTWMVDHLTRNPSTWAAASPTRCQALWSSTTQAQQLRTKTGLPWTQTRTKTTSIAPSTTWTQQIPWSVLSTNP